MAEKINLIFDAKMEVSQIRGAVQELQRNLSSMSMPKNLGEELESRLNRLNKELDNFDTASSKAVTSLKDVKTISSSFDKLTSLASQVKQTLGKIGQGMDVDPSKFFPTDVEKRINAANNAIKQYNSTIEAGNDELKQQKQQLEDINKQIKSQKADLGKKQSKTSGYQSKVNKTKTIADDQEKNSKEIEAAAQKSIAQSREKIRMLDAEKAAIKDYNTAAKAKAEAEKAVQETGGKDTEKNNDLAVATQNYNKAKAAVEKYGAAIRSIEEVNLDKKAESTNISRQEAAIRRADTAVQNANKAFQEAKSTLSSHQQELKNDETALESLKLKQEQITQTIKETESAIQTGAMDQLAQAFREIGITIDPATTSMEDIQRIISQMNTSAVDKLKESLKQAGVNIDGLNLGLNQVGEKKSKLQGVADSAAQMNNEFQQVKSQVQYFFSLINVAQLLRRVFQDVTQTIKDLDAVMTETAVVTDFSVSDMWDKLPEYTEHAKALGVATKDLYAATTLYYQQGLDTNASMAAGIETMKMARIAGMEAAEATDAMTAALRGFKMEVNETNAQKVNDVYSKLAAITASDTEEIATAMSKTASIASSVGAEFENIAAFLAQGIETTRESADSIGTAMKTVLARFNELTKDPSEIKEEVDGEIVDANKVDAALKSVGISLLDMNNQFRDADEVFLEVAQKWDSMTTMQQRYIATQAAGSRQQSRFIAMMSDYNRTLELQTAAYNAEGASQEQFEKTLESLESKLAKLKNTWDEFILGITDSSLIKGSVDVLAKLLDIINKISNIAGPFDGILKGLMAFGAYKGGKTIVNALMTGFEKGKLGVQQGQVFGEGFSKGFSQTMKQSSTNFKKGIGSLFDKTGSTKNAAALNNYNHALQESIKANQNAAQADAARTLAVNKQNTAIDTNSDFTEAAVDYTNADTLATQANATAKEKDLAVTTAFEGIQGLSNKQKAEAILLNKNGINSHLALIAAKRGLTHEELKEIAAKNLGNKYTKEELRNEMERIILSKLSLVQRAKLSLAMIKSNLIQQANLGLNQKEKMSIYGKVTAWLTEKLAIEATTAATVVMISVTALAIGAVAGLVAIIALLVKTSKESTLAYKMEQAAEATKRATEAANTAKDAYEDLLSSKEEFTEFQNTLEDLTYGTLEWKKALIEANQQVLELLKTYPTLAQYTTKTDQGVLSISEKGWNNLLEIQMQTIELTQTASTLSSLQELRLSKPQVELSSKEGYFGALGTELLTDVVFRVFDPQLYIDLISGKLFEDVDPVRAESAQNYSLSTKMLQDFQENVDIFDEEYLKSLQTEYSHLSLEQLKEYARDIEEYSNNLENYNAQVETISQSLMDSVSEISNLEEGKDIAHTLGERFNNEYDEMLQQALKEGPSTYEKAIREYAELMNLPLETVKDQYEHTKDGLKQLKNDIATLKVSEEINKQAKNFAKAWANLNEIEKKDISALGSYGGESLTQAQIEFFDSADKIEKYLQEAAIDPLLYGFDTVSEMADSYYQNIITARESFKETDKEIKALTSGLFGLPTKINDISNFTPYLNLINDMTLTAQKNFNAKLSQVMLDMGEEGLRNYLYLSEDIMNSLSKTAQKKFIEGFSVIELEEIESVEDLKQSLEDLGISSLELSKEELEELSKKIMALGSIAKRSIVDIEEAKKQIDAGVKSKKILQEAIDDNENQFEKEDYETLKAAGVSIENFFYDGETYTYLGDTVDLLQQIKADTEAMRQKMLAQIEQDTIEGAAIADWVNGNNLIANRSWWQIITGQDGEEYSRESLIQSALAGEAITAEDGTVYDAKTIMEQIFPDMSDEIADWTEKMAKVQLQSYYDKYGLGGTKYTENLGVLGTYYDEQYGAIAANQSGIENASMYREATAEINKYQSKLEKNIDLTEEEQIALKKVEAQQRKSKQALEAKAKALGMTTQEIEEYLGKEKGEGLLGQVVTEKQLEANLKKAKEETQDYFDVLKEGATGAEKDNALSGLVQAADQYLGLEIDKAFLEDAENLEAFKAALNGTKEDFYKFINSLSAATQQSLLGIQTSTDAVTQAFASAEMDVNEHADAITEVADMMDDINFDIDGTADFTQIFSALYAVTGDAEKAYTILEQLAGTGVTFSADGYVEGMAMIEEGRSLIKNAGSGPLSTIQTMLGLSKMIAGAAKMKVTGHLTGGGVNSYSPTKVSGSNGGGGSSEKYDPDYDKYYNILEKINKLQEDRATLQEEYDKLLEDENASLAAIQAKQDAIIKNLKEEKKYQDQLTQGRLAQLRQEQKENSDLTQYAWFDEKLGKVQINWEKINAVTDPEKGEKIDNYISNLEGYADGYNEARQSSREIDNDIAELTEAGKNDLDDSFDTLEKIEKVENKITNLQAERENLLANAKENSEAILENYAKEKELLDQQLATQRALNEERVTQHNKNLEDAQAAGVMDYITDLGDGQFTVDQEELDKLNQDEQDFIIGWLDKLNESGEAVQETTEAVNEAEQAVIDFKDTLQEGAFDFFDQIKEMLIEDYQRKIDQLSTESEAISSAESKIFDTIQKSLDRQRQEEENADTEEDIQDKEARLAYLQANTTGANDLEIKNLQKEIQEQKEDYTDTLIDQKISELQQQNDEAAAQRETQINIAQAQLEEAQRNGEINEAVQNIVTNGIGLDGSIAPESALADLIANSADYTGLTATEQKTYQDEITQSITDYLSYIGLYKAVGGEDSEYKKDDDISSALGGLPAGATATVRGEGDVRIDLGDGRFFDVSGVTTDMLGDLDFSHLTGAQLFYAKDARKILRASARLETLTPEEKAKYDLNRDGKITAADARLALRYAARLDDIDFGDDRYNEADFFGAVALIDQKGYDKIYDLNHDGKLNDTDLQMIVDNFGVPKSMFAFKTGGLADFTGPAWLDGTKTKPEMVLNARDTENFIQLKDILSSVMKNIDSKKTDEKTGDMYYEIHIEVEKMTSDYDVDDVANRVKTIISQDAMYRNTNLISRLR